MKMKIWDRFYHGIYEPLAGRSRWPLALLAILPVLAMVMPLWSLDFMAPQYPAGLELSIYSWTVEGDVQEINTLNHYIGMQSIDRSTLSDLTWLPIALGALALATLRVAAIGNLRMLIDLLVSFFYLSAFAFARFVYRLYLFGHEFDPEAPITVDPFMPAIMGTKQIANFTTTSMPALGSFWLAAFAIGIVAIALWNLGVVMREPGETERAEGKRL
jgi:hypothetical protein